jgi:hypothetical protein
MIDPTELAKPWSEKIRDQIERIRDIASDIGDLDTETELLLPEDLGSYVKEYGRTAEIVEIAKCGARIGVYLEIMKELGVPVYFLEAARWVRAIDTE